MGGAGEQPRQRRTRPSQGPGEPGPLRRAVRSRHGQGHSRAKAWGARRSVLTATRGGPRASCWVWVGVDVCSACCTEDQRQHHRNGWRQGRRPAGGCGPGGTKQSLRDPQKQLCVTAQKEFRHPLPPPGLPPLPRQLPPIEIKKLKVWARIANSVYDSRKDLSSGPGFP